MSGDISGMFERMRAQNADLAKRIESLRAARHESAVAVSRSASLPGHSSPRARLSHSQADGRTVSRVSPSRNSRAHGGTARFDDGATADEQQRGSSYQPLVVSQLLRDSSHSTDHRIAPGMLTSPAAVSPPRPPIALDGPHVSANSAPLSATLDHGVSRSQDRPSVSPQARQPAASQSRAPSPDREPASIQLAVTEAGHWRSLAGHERRRREEAELAANRASSASAVEASDWRRRAEEAEAESRRMAYVLSSATDRADTMQRERDTALSDAAASKRRAEAARHSLEAIQNAVIATNRASGNQDQSVTHGTPSVASSSGAMTGELVRWLAGRAGQPSSSSNNTDSAHFSEDEIAELAHRIIDVDRRAVQANGEVQGLERRLMEAGAATTAARQGEAKALLMAQEADRRYTEAASEAERCRAELESVEARCEEEASTLQEGVQSALQRAADKAEEAQDALRRSRSRLQQEAKARREAEDEASSRAVEAAQAIEDAQELRLKLKATTESLERARRAADTAETLAAERLEQLNADRPSAVSAARREAAASEERQRLITALREADDRISGLMRSRQADADEAAHLKQRADRAEQRLVEAEEAAHKSNRAVSQLQVQLDRAAGALETLQGDSNQQQRKLQSHASELQAAQDAARSARQAAEDAATRAERLGVALEAEKRRSADLEAQSQTLAGLAAASAVAATAPSARNRARNAVTVSSSSSARARSPAPTGRPHHLSGGLSRRRPLQSDLVPSRIGSPSYRIVSGPHDGSTVPTKADGSGLSAAHASISHGASSEGVGELAARGLSDAASLLAGRSGILLPSDSPELTRTTRHGDHTGPYQTHAASKYKSKSKKDRARHETMPPGQSRSVSPTQARMQPSDEFAVGQSRRSRSHSNTRETFRPDHLSAFPISPPLIAELKPHASRRADSASQESFAAPATSRGRRSGLPADVASPAALWSRHSLSPTERYNHQYTTPEAELAAGLRGSAGSGQSRRLHHSTRSPATPTMDTTRSASPNSKRHLLQSPPRVTSRGDWHTIELGDWATNGDTARQTPRGSTGTPMETRAPVMMNIPSGIKVNRTKARQVAKRLERNVERRDAILDSLRQSRIASRQQGTVEGANRASVSPQRRPQTSPSPSGSRLERPRRAIVTPAPSAAQRVRTASRQSTLDPTHVPPSLTSAGSVHVVGRDTSPSRSPSATHMNHDKELVVIPVVVGSSRVEPDEQRYADRPQPSESANGASNGFGRSVTVASAIASTREASSHRHKAPPVVTPSSHDDAGTVAYTDPAEMTIATSALTGGFRPHHTATMPPHPPHTPNNKESAMEPSSPSLHRSVLSARTTPASKRDGHRRLCNAVSRVLLAGDSRQKLRERALAAIAGASDRHVVAAFEGSGSQRGPLLGLYGMRRENHEAERILAVVKGAPVTLHRPMMQAFYKFDTVARSFVQIDSIMFTPTTDAVGLGRLR